jgi:hypothetical protein
MKLSKKKIIISIVFFIIIVLALLFFFPSQILGIFFRDIKPIDDSDLTFEKMVVPQEQNAYYDLEEASSKAYWPEGSYEKYKNCLEGGNCDEAFLKEINDKNQEFFSIIDRSLEKQFFVYPGMESPDKVDDYNTKLKTWGSATYVPSARVLYLSKQGRDKEALDEAFKIFTLSRKIRDGRPSFVMWLESIGLEARAINAAKLSINNSKISSEELLQYANKIEGMENDSRESLVLIEKAKYLSKIKFINDLHLGQVTYSGFLTMYSADGKAINSPSTEFDKMFTSDFYFQENRMKSFFARDAKVFIEEEKNKCSLGLSPVYSPSESEIFTYEPRFYPNSAGLMLYENVVGGSTHLQGCDIQTKLVELQALLALKVYEREHGSMPYSLESVPGVPKDPYSGKALIYSLEKNIIYSVGRDLTDDGGDEEKDIVMDIRYDELKDILPAGIEIETIGDKKIIKNKAQGYELEYSAELVARENEQGYIKLFDKKALEKDCFVCPPNIIIGEIDNPDNLSLEDLLYDWHKKYGFTYWDEKQKVAINGFDGYKIEEEGDPSTYGYYFAKGDRLYSIHTLQSIDPNYYLIDEIVFK